MFDLLLRSKFFKYGNEILASIILVTCPCDVLYEQLENIAQQSTKSVTRFNWLNTIRPDWFDVNYEMRTQVKTFLTIENIVKTKQNNIPIDKLATIIIENSELHSHRSVIIHLIMEYERWDLINLFPEQERDWSFLDDKSTKVNRENLS